MCRIARLFVWIAPIVGCAGAKTPGGRDDAATVGGFTSTADGTTGSDAVGSTDTDPAPSTGHGTAAETSTGDNAETMDTSSGAASSTAGSTTGLPTDTTSSGASGESTSSDSSTGPGATSTGASDTGTVGLLDLSGYIVAQTASAREIVLPDDTFVSFGGVLVIGRDASQAEFEAFWGVSLAADVRYLNAVDVFPALNGGETISIRDLGDAVIDGPSPALTLSAALARIDADANDFGAWSESITPDVDATPGIADAIGGDAGVPYVSEVVDAPGGGNYFYEYVEIAVGE